MTERLTERSDGGFYILDKHKAAIFMYNKYYAGKAIDKLAQYETVEEEGRLAVLPCKVGDILFCFSRGEIYPFKVRCIRIYEERAEIELWYAGDEENLKFWHITIMEQDVGYKFFFTREEAEKALKEMEGKQSE